MARHAARSQILQELQGRLRGLERAGRTAGRGDGVVSTGVDALDRLLPAGGLHRGTMVEWLVDGPGSGVGTLVLTVAARRMQAGGALVAVDERGELYAPAVAALGIDLDRTIVVRPGDPRDVVWSLEQALRSAGVAASLGWLGRASQRVLRRLQLAAEQGGGMGLLIRPEAIAAREPCWADARLLVRPMPPADPLSPSHGRRLRVTLLYCRGGISGGATDLEIHHEEGHVRVASPVVPATALRRATGA